MKFLGLLLLVFSLSAWADSPPNWPWRGITIGSFGGDNDIIEIKRLAKLHVNAVALALSVRSTAEFENMTPEGAWNTNIMWADSMLDACKRYGIEGIITFTEVPIDPSKGYNETKPEFWENPFSREEAVRLAGKLAKHFSSRGKELGAYEILSEPVVYRGSKVESPQSWPELREKIIREIRKYDPNRYIIVTPGFGGETSSYKDFSPLPFKHIIYGTHIYNPHLFTHQGLRDIPRGMTYPGKFDKNGLEESMKPLIDFKDKYHALIYVGEFSAIRWAPGANQYVSDLIDLFDKHGFGWMYFCYNSFHGWNPSYDEEYVAPGDSPAPWSWVGFKSKRWAVLKKAYGKNVEP